MSSRAFERLHCGQSWLTVLQFPVSTMGVNLIRFLTCTLFLLGSVALGQSPSPQLPCDFSGELLRTNEGRVVQYASDEMKRRATRKVDVSGSIKQADIKGTAIVDVLVGTSGEVVCMKSLIGHAMIRKGVETALRSWTFRRAEVGGKPVSYLGRLEFTLCNINCSEQGSSMTLLK